MEDIANTRTARWTRPARAFLARLVVFAEAIKVSHSVFALPFALAALFIAAAGLPPLLPTIKVILACVAARTAAMAHNRYLDAALDGRNPRTAGRAVPAGLLSRGFMGGAALVSSLLFVACALWIHALAFALSPIVLVVLLGYSYTKRFTSLSHLVLGAALGLSPLGAWVALRAEVALLPAVLGAAVLLWTAGFDVIYACQDTDFDRREGLHSIPSRLGVGPALWLARSFHATAVLLLAVLGVLAGYGGWYAGGVAAVAVLIAYEHSLVSPRDLSRVNVAFFALNGMVSLAFLVSVILETVVS